MALYKFDVRVSAYGSVELELEDDDAAEMMASYGEDLADRLIEQGVYLDSEVDYIEVKDEETGKWSVVE